MPKVKFKKPPSQKMGDQCYWFDKPTKLLSDSLFFPNITNISLSNNLNFKSAFTNKIQSFNQNNNNNTFTKLNIPTHADEVSKLAKKKIKSINNIKTTLTDSEKVKKLNEINNKYIKLNNNIGKVIRSYKYEIIFNNKQHNIIKNWIKICNHFYNFCIVKHQEHHLDPKHIYSFNSNYKAIKAEIFKDYFENYLTKDNKDVILYNINIITKEGSKPIPYDMITDELRIFCSNLKSGKTNVANGNYKHFTMKEQLYKRKIRSILLPKKAISINGIYKNKLGKLKNLNKDVKTLINNNEIESDCRLVYDYVLKKVYILAPINITKSNPINREKYIALDPGEKVFQTFYGEKSCGTFGENNRGYQDKLNIKIEKNIILLLNGKNKNGTTLKNRLKIKKKIYMLRQKRKNIVIDFQNKVANYICKKYERILLPTFNVKHMVRKEGVLRSKVKRNLLQLSHYRFKQHITHKSEEYGCKIDIVEEDYTSKCCGRCGKLSNNFINREKVCEHCKERVDRDINGSFNILLKNRKKIIC